MVSPPSRWGAHLAAWGFKQRKNGMEGDTIQKVYIYNMYDIYIFIIGIYIYIYNMYSIYIYILLYKFLDGETVEVNLLFFLTF